MSKHLSFLAAALSKDPEDLAQKVSNAARAFSNELRSRRIYGFVNKDYINPDGEQPYKQLGGLQQTRCGMRMMTYDHRDQVFRQFIVPEFFQGFVKDSGRGFATLSDDFLKEDFKKYQISAYYDPYVDPHNPVLSNTLAGKMDIDYERHAIDRLDRDQKHFTLFCVELDDLPEDIQDVINIDTYTEAFQGNSFDYVIDRSADGKFSVRLFIPTWRSNGHFVKSPLNGGTNLIPKRIVEHIKGLDGQNSFETLEEARDAVERHWQGYTNEKGQLVQKGLCQKFMEESRNVCSTFSSQMKYKAARLAHFLPENPRPFTVASLAAALSVVAHVKEVGALLFATALLDVVAEKSVEGYETSKRKLKAQFASAADYGSGNCADIANKGRLDSVCPELDGERIEAVSNQVLSFEQCNPKHNEVVMDPSVDPLGVQMMILRASGRNVGSKSYVRPHCNMDTRFYNDGLVVTKIGLPAEHDFTSVYFSSYRSDIILNQKEKLHPSHQEQLKGGVHVMWKPRGALSEAQGLVVHQGLTVEEATVELGIALDAGGCAKWSLEREDVIEAFKANYAAVESGEDVPALYARGGLGAPPPATSIVEAQPDMIAA